MTIANTVNQTTFRSVRLKLNEVIARVNVLGTGEVSNSTFQSFVANTNLAISSRIQVANADNKYTTKAYSAANSYVNLLLANTNAYIAQVAAASSPSSESIDYGFVISAVDPDTQRDYGTL
jgi:hypothetical protein